MSDEPERFAVRAGTSADLDVVVAFNAQMALETEGLQLEDAVLRPGVAKALADPERGRYYLAERRGELVGQLMLTREWSDWRNGWFWWIQSVHVVPTHRRSGVFRALYRHVVAEARAAGNVIGLRLYVEGENDVAHEVYRTLGMRRTGYQLWEDDWSGTR